VRAGAYDNNSRKRGREKREIKERKIGSRF
jgi:hypothetical protein